MGFYAGYPRPAFSGNIYFASHVICNNSLLTRWIPTEGSGLIYLLLRGCRYIYPAMYILLYVSTYFSHVAIYTVAHLSIHLYRH